MSSYSADVLNTTIAVSRLNSREARNSEVFFSGGGYGLKVIERTHRRAAAEAWNAPQVCTAAGLAVVDCSAVTNHYVSARQLPDDEPAPINIKVTTEMENERGWGRYNENCSDATSSELGYTI